MEKSGATRPYIEEILIKEVQNLFFRENGMSLVRGVYIDRAFLETESIQGVISSNEE